MKTATAFVAAGRPRRATFCLCLGRVALLALLCASLPASATAAPRIGLGGNVGSGVIVAGVPGFAPVVTAGYIIPAPEIQIFPNKIFSIDLQWNVWNMVISAIETGPNFSMQTFFHFHIPINKVLRFGVAPGVKYGAAMISNTPVGIFGYVMRIGPELLVPGGHFALGFYARPMTAVAAPRWGDPVGVFEMLGEVTWTFYPKAL